MMASEWRHSLSRERRGCRARILRLSKKKDITLKELLVLYQEKRIFLFKGHVKELHKMILEENDKDALAGNIQSWPSLHRRIIKRTVNREGCTLREFGKRKLNKNVRMELDRMIQNEEEQNIEQEKKTASTSAKPLVVACRLNSDGMIHWVNVCLNVHQEALSLSSRALCGELVTRDGVLNFSNKATCRACLREEAKRNNQEK